MRERERERARERERESERARERERECKRSGACYFRVLAVGVFLDTGRRKKSLFLFLKLIKSFEIGLPPYHLVWSE